MTWQTIDLDLLPAPARRVHAFLEAYATEEKPSRQRRILPDIIAWVHHPNPDVADTDLTVSDLVDTLRELVAANARVPIAHAGDYEVSRFVDAGGSWVGLEVFDPDAEAANNDDEQVTAAHLIMSDVEAATLADLLTPDTVAVPRALLEEWHRILGVGFVYRNEAQQIADRIATLLPEETEGETAP
jgi:hypothetical protein